MALIEMDRTSGRDVEAEADEEDEADQKKTRREKRKSRRVSLEKQRSALTADMLNRLEKKRGVVVNGY
jgi:hypothetical protein